MTKSKLRIVKIFLHSYLLKLLLQWRWDFGFILNSLESIIAGDELQIVWSNIPCKDRWFADPFILDYDKETIYVLCEEMMDSADKGRIAIMEIDRKTYQYRNHKILLDLENHLSFPVVLREKGHIYVCPENSASGKWDRYELEGYCYSLKYKDTLSNRALIDAIPLKYEGQDLLFATEEPNANGHILNVFEKNEGKYHFKETIYYNDNHARMAGYFFTIREKLYRPAQDCNETYGGAVILEEIWRDDEGWHSKPVRTLKSNHKTLNFGLHTFNSFKGLTIIDVKGFKYPRLVRVMKKVVNLLKG